VEVTTLGLFERRIAGDDCLLKLASRRFFEFGMGAEMHAGTTEYLESVMRFRPWPAAPVTVHLPRDFNLVEAQTRERICDFASRFAGRVSGFVIHDHKDMQARRKDYIDAARWTNDRLQKIDRCPVLFIEYAIGMDPADFAQFFLAINDLDQIGPCIDIGHVGIGAARAVYAQTHQGEDVCTLKSQGPRLPLVISDVQAAVASGFTSVLDLVRVLSTLDRPVHFHLHDGHPLSTFSPFGVADHLSFFREIPLNFEYQGRRAVGLMFGPSGLARLVAHALNLLRRVPVSFSLEIHPTGERLALGDATPLFEHWVDKTNAEEMNQWLAVLAQNHELLRKTISLQPGVTPLASNLIRWDSPPR
jgi:hypothetical protein